MPYFHNPADVKVGVVGYGGAFNMGKRHLSEMKKAGMTPFAVCELDESRLEEAKKDFPGIETYPNLDAMLKKSDVNLLVHITPHHLHYPLAAKCLKAGKHVVTEKPFVLTTAEADKLIALAEKHDVMVSTYHNRHWDGHILRAVREVVEKKVIGDVYKVVAHMGGHQAPKDWWRTSKAISGGILYDWGVHQLEYCLQLIDSEMVEVSGFATHGVWESRTPKDYRWRGDMNEDEATAVIRFANGARVELCVTQLDPVQRPPLNIHGKHGLYTIDSYGWGGPDDGREWTLRRANKKGELKETHGKNPKARGHLFYKNVAEYLTGEAKLIITPQWARRPIHALDLAKRSAEQGKTLRAKYG